MPERTFTLGPDTKVRFILFGANQAHGRPSTAPALREDLKVGQEVNLVADENRVAHEIAITWKGRLRPRPPTTPAATTRPAAREP
jgi:hypothetical protein